MVAEAIEAVWVWCFGTAAFKATYGRFSGTSSSGYTKNYLQVSGECRDLLSTSFHLGQREDAKREVTYLWPGGEVTGHINWSNDRLHLNWPMGGAPLPWKLTVNPVEATVGVIPGDPHRGTDHDADIEWAALDAKGLDPYLVAVKLRGEPDRLHLRAYLGNAPQGMEWASLDSLPEPIRSVALSAKASRGCASLEVRGGVTAAPEVVTLLEHLEDNPNVLLTGPPGTGKTVLLEKLVRFVEHSSGGLLFDADEPHSAFSEQVGGIPGKSRTVVLHPAYSYENLVVGLFPKPATKGGVVVEPVAGPLISLARYAQVPGRRALLVLDEFNRGNAAAVLGDTIALLDKDKRGVAVVDLPYSSDEVPSPFSLPRDLWIVAAMNSSDRSVAPLDAALRRRFTIIEMPPNYDALSENLGADANADFEVPFDDWTPETVFALAVELLRAINGRIDAVLGADFRLGQSNFWNVSGTTTAEAALSLANAFDYRIVSTLKLAMQDDESALAAVLRAGSAEGTNGGGFAIARWLKGNAELGTYASARLHVYELHRLPLLEAVTELRRQAER